MKNLDQEVKRKLLEQLLMESQSWDKQRIRPQPPMQPMEMPPQDPMQVAQSGSQVSDEEAQAAIDRMLGRNQPSPEPMPPAPQMQEQLPVPGAEDNLEDKLKQKNKHKLIEEYFNKARQ